MAQGTQGLPQRRLSVAACLDIPLHPQLSIRKSELKKKYFILKEF